MGLPDNLPWTRYWACLESETRFDLDDFLPGLSEDWFEWIPGYPRPLAHLREIPVLVLLGESGMGKSDALRREHEELAGGSAEGKRSRLLDLASLGSEQLLRDRINEQLEPPDDQSTLVLHFDSFDECRIDVHHLPRIFEEVFSRMTLPVETVQIRFACRSAEWSAYLNAVLDRIWGNECVEVRTLCQLRTADVAEAARAAGIDGAAFLDAVATRDIESLASRPKTLGYLLDEYAQSGDLPRRRWPLYEGGIAKLCEEAAEREDSGRGGDLTARERMVIAARMAAVTIFSNQPGLRVGRSYGVPPGAALDIESLCGDDPGPGKLQVSLPAVRETLRIGGLFRRSNVAVVDFRHRSDAEFLAAWYLRHLKAPAHINQALLRDPDGGWLPPQLAGVAAWVAEQDETVRDWMIEHYPIQFLASDVDLDDATRRLLVDALVQHVHEGGTVSLVPLHRLARLSHPRLPAQLRILVVDASAHLAARYLAFDLAEACDFRSELVAEAHQVLDDPAEFEGPRARCPATGPSGRDRAGQGSRCLAAVRARCRAERYG